MSAEKNIDFLKKIKELKSKKGHFLTGNYEGVLENDFGGREAVSGSDISGRDEGGNSLVSVVGYAVLTEMFYIVLIMNGYPPARGDYVVGATGRASAYLLAARSETQHDAVSGLLEITESNAGKIEGRLRFVTHSWHPDIPVYTVVLNFSVQLEERD